MSEVEESWALTDDGVRLWTVRSGRGSQPLVLCHGGPGSWDQMEPVAEMLDDVAQVVRWDQRGCGRSEGDGPYTCDRFLADLDVIRQHWELASWTVAGHSAGASLALFYALAYPQHTHSVIYMSGTGLHWGERDSHAYRANREARLGRFRDRWQTLRAESTLGAAERRELMLLTSSTDFGDTESSLGLAEEWLDERYEPNMACNAALGAEMEQRTASARERLSTLTCPVLVIHGGGDPRPASAAVELAHALPNAHLDVLEGVGHLPWAQHPSLLRGALHNFLPGGRSGTRNGAERAPFPVPEPERTSIRRGRSGRGS